MCDFRYADMQISDVQNDVEFENEIVLGVSVRNRFQIAELTTFKKAITMAFLNV